MGELRGSDPARDLPMTLIKDVDQTTIRGVNAFHFYRSALSGLRSLSYPCTVQASLFDELNAVAVLAPGHRPGGFSEQLSKLPSVGVAHSGGRRVCSF